MKPPGAPILGIAAPLDQSRFLEPIDDPAQGDRLDIEMIGELDLAQAGRPRQPRQRPPLGTRNAQWSDPAVERTTQRVGRFGNLKWKRINVHGCPYNKYAY